MKPYILMKTKQHLQGAFAEKLIYSYFKKNKEKVFTQKNIKRNFKLPEEVKEYINKNYSENIKIIKILEEYPFDILKIKKQLEVFEIKSKIVKFNKDDRKFDTSKIQIETFKKLSDLNIKVKILFLWLYNEKFYFKTYDFKDLKIIGVKKPKFYLQKIYYSPKYKTYTPIKKYYDVN